MMKFSFDYTEPIVDHALGDRVSDNLFFEVHQAFNYLLNAEPTIPESTYDNIVRSLANAYRWGVVKACERIATSTTDVKHDLANMR